MAGRISDLMAVIPCLPASRGAAQDMANPQARQMHMQRIMHQRSYHSASDASRPAIRKQIEALITQHFDLEDQLRALEVADIERRLADVRAENQRRRDNRSEFIKFAVDDIVRDAIRPR